MVDRQRPRRHPPGVIRLLRCAVLFILVGATALATAQEQEAPAASPAPEAAPESNATKTADEEARPAEPKPKVEPDPKPKPMPNVEPRAKAAPKPKVEPRPEATPPPVRGPAPSSTRSPVEPAPADDSAGPSKVARAEARPPEVVDEALRTIALLFFTALREQVPEAIGAFAHYPFNLDGEILSSRAALVDRLRQAFASRDLSPLTWYGMKTYSAAHMVEEWGAPPARLAALDLTDAWVAIANLGGHGYVAIFKKRGDTWVAIGYTD